MSSSSIVDTKACAKALKACIDKNEWETALAQVPFLQPDPAIWPQSDLLAATKKDAKQRTLIYSILLFTGLAHFKLGHIDLSEKCYARATQIDEAQFPAWKGLYEVYGRVGDEAKLRSTLEKLTPIHPPGPKKLALIVQLIRLQLTQPPTSNTPEPSALHASISDVLADNTLSSIPLTSAAPSSELARLRLDAYELLARTSEAVETAAKDVERKVRLDRQLRKYRDEREKADKQREKQAASKSGAIASAVAAAKGAAGSSTAASPSQAEEEADIVRRVCIKLEKDFLEKSDLDTLYDRILTVSAAPSTTDGMDAVHLYVREKQLLRLLLVTHIHAELTTSAESYGSAIRKLEERARSLDNDSAHRSRLALRILIGLHWRMHGAKPTGKEERRREELRKVQAEIERAIQLFSAEPTSKANVDDPLSDQGWIAWHALATLMCTTEQAPTIPLPADLQKAVDSLSAPPSIHELAELIIRHAPGPTATLTSPPSSPASASSTSASSSSAAPAPHHTTAFLSTILLTTPSPLTPSFLSYVTLAYCLQQQGESRNKECLQSIQHGLQSTRSYRTAYALDVERIQHALNHLELTLAAAYSTRHLDERIIEQAVKICHRVRKAIRDASAAAATIPTSPADVESAMRALQCLTHCALLRKPIPNYAEADAYVDELSQLRPEDDFVYGMRGSLKLQEARQADSKQATMAALQDAISYLENAVRLNTSSAAHQLRLGQAYFELETQSEQPSSAASSDPQRALRCFEEAERLTSAQLPPSILKSPAAPTTSSAITTLRSLLADSLAYQGAWHEQISHQPDAAKRCFVRTLNVDPSNEMAGVTLCDQILTAKLSKAPADGDEAAARRAAAVRVAAAAKLARAAVHHNPRCQWAWIRLARCQVSQSNVSAAIVSYQNALRLDPTSVSSVASTHSDTACDVWHELADCYTHEGHHVAAYKAMVRCIEIAESSPHSVPGLNKHEYMLARCQLNMQDTSAAIATLQQSLKLSTKDDIFFPSVLLLAEALYIQANEHLLAGAYISSINSLVQAIDAAKRCNQILNALPQSSDADTSHSSVSLPRHLVSVWKLLGDCYALFHSLPCDDDEANNALASLDASLPVPPVSPDLPLCERRKLAFLTLSTRAYAKATHLNPTIAEHWYDAALSQMRCALALHAPPATAAPPSASISLSSSPPLHPLESLYRARSLRLVKSSLLLRPDNNSAWHLLAVADPRPVVRQHALARAIKTDPKDCIGWTALGCLYLQHYHNVNMQQQVDMQHERESMLALSRRCLEVGQTLDPSNPSLWLAQGLFNQGAVGSFDAFVQAKACFERSVELYPTQVARFGLAYTSYCIGDIPAASFAVRKFIQQYPRHATAWNLAGLIFEHQVVAASANNKSQSCQSQSVSPFAMEAVAAFRRAETLLEWDKQFAVDPMRLAELRRMVRVNMARVMATARMFEESIKLYQALIMQAAESAQTGTVSPAAVLASAFTLHVDLANVYLRAGSLPDCINMLQTGVGITAQQIAAIPDPASMMESDPSQTESLHQQKSEIVAKRRSLMLQQAQVYTMNKQYDEAKQTLQLSVSEHPEYPHPTHYFHVMCALYAVSLQQSDRDSAQYAISLLAQCLAGLQSDPQHSADAMDRLLPIFHRIQAHMAILSGNLTDARRIYQRIIHLNPVSLQGWNEFYSFGLRQHEETSEVQKATPLSAVLNTATLPPLDFIHINKMSESAYLEHMQLIAAAFMQIGRVGDVRIGAAMCTAQSTDEDKEGEQAAKLFAENEADDESEVKDDTEDEDVRDRSAATLDMQISTSEIDSWPRAANLNSTRLTAHLMHMDPTNTDAWSIHACSVYAQAIQAATVDPASATTGILLSKAINLLRIHATLLSTPFTIPQQLVPASFGNNATSPLRDQLRCNSLIADALIRRSTCRAAGSDSQDDLGQAKKLIEQLETMQQEQHHASTSSAVALHLLHARLSLATGSLASAMRSYRAALDKQPLAVEVWEEIAEVYRASSKMGTCAGGEKTAEAALLAPVTLIKQHQEQGNNDASHLPLLRRLYLRLSHLSYVNGRLSSSIDYAQKCIRETGWVGESSAAGYFMLGLAQSTIGHPDQANRAFQYALNLIQERHDGSNTAIQCAAASTPLALLRLNTALLLLRKVGHGATSAGVPAAASDKQNPVLQEAHDLLVEELRDAPLPLAPVYYHLARTSKQLGRLSEASSSIRSALALRPNDGQYTQLQEQIDGEISMADQTLTTPTNANATTTSTSAAAAEVPDSWEQI